MEGDTDLHGHGMEGDYILFYRLDGSGMVGHSREAFLLKRRTSCPWCRVPLARIKGNRCFLVSVTQSHPAD